MKVVLKNAKTGKELFSMAEHIQARDFYDKSIMPLSDAIRANSAPLWSGHQVLNSYADAIALAVRQGKESTFEVRRTDLTITVSLK